MSGQRLIASLIAIVTTLATLVFVPTSASAATCAGAWSSSNVYTNGMTASYNNHNWLAQWWTQSDTPGSAGVWKDQGACGGGSTPNCDYPNWAQGTNYVTGNIVKYTNGRFYKATHDNPGYDPVISTWFWEPFTCGGTPGPDPDPGTGDFVVSQAQFNQMFPSRNPFYTYSGLTAALSAYPNFANTGDITLKRREAAAFLANINHESGGLVHIVEQDTSNYPHYCDTGRPYGCPAGNAMYYGRGPIQLSWNFNYKAAGDSLGIDLLNNPRLVETDSAVAWKTALWYWNTQSGPGTMTPHDAIVNNRGFGETIRSINGEKECGGRNPGQVQSRINSFQSFTQLLGTTTGDNLYC